VLPKIENDEKCISVNSSSFSILATFPFNVKIGENLFELPIGVVNRLPHPLLIGNDVIKSHNIDIIQSQGHLLIGNEKVEIVQNTKIPACSSNTTYEKTDAAIVCFIKSIQIPPMSECIVPCSVISTKPSQELLFEANESYCEENHIFAATALVKSYDSIIPCRILNVNKKPIVLDAGKSIGSATEQFEIPVEQETREENFASEIKACVTRANISSEEKDELEKILIGNSEIFAQTNRELGKTSIVKHKIRTGDARPVQGRKFRTPYAYREKLKQTIDEMLADKIIKPSRSEWSNPIFLVKKKDGSMRPVVDYRELNKITEPDVYPIPMINEYLDSLGNATIFTTLDLRSGFWQIAMDDESKEKTSFSSPFGNFSFEVMPFGVRNAPSEFSRLMDIVLLTYNGKRHLSISMT